MKYHCYIIQPLQSCEIWIPSPMSNFFAESPKLYKRWQGCSFNHIWKESQTQFYFVCKFLNLYHRKAQNPIFIFFCNCLNPHHTPGESDQELCFGGRRIRWEDQNMMQCLKMYINDQRRRMKFLSKYEMIGGKIRELIDTKYSRKPASQPSGAIQVKGLYLYQLIIIIIININWW